MKRARLGPAIAAVAALALAGCHDSRDAQEIERLKGVVARNADDLAQFRSQADAIRAEEAQLIEKLRQAETAKAVADAELSRRDSDAAQLQVRVKELEARVQDGAKTAGDVDRKLRSDLAQAIADRDKACRDAAAARQAASAKDADIAKLNASLKDAAAKLKSAQSGNQADDKKIKSDQDCIKDLSAQVADLEKKLQAANAKAKKSDDRADSLQGQVDDLKKEITRLRKKLADETKKP